MNKQVCNLKTFQEIIRLTSNLYRLGWDERNGGNISVLLSNDEVELIKDLPTIRTYNLSTPQPLLANKYFIVTGTGKYFKNVEVDPDNTLGVFRISKDGDKAELIDGLFDGKGPTSELPTHLMCHVERLKVDPLQKVVIHTHPTNTIAMTLMIDQDEDAITRALWKMQTESIVVFPEGIGYLPWMVCGGDDIGKATAEKMKLYRVVIWGMHGIFGTGQTIDDAFGLIETIEKAAQIWVLTKGEAKYSIKEDDLKELAKTFHVKYKEII